MNFIYPIGCTPSCCAAADHLRRLGFSLTDHPCPEVTHVLLDIPSFRSSGILRCGVEMRSVLEALPESAAIIGGNLNDDTILDRRRIDLLQDPFFLAQNAAITAYCAVSLASQKLTCIFPDLPVLVIGFGRIGKVLADLLARLRCRVAVYARKDSDRALAASLGYTAVSPDALEKSLPAYRLIFNTVPAPVITAQQSKLCRDCLKLDLASVPGIAGDDVISARGLPGQYAPESAGKLIAESVSRLPEVSL